MSPTLADESTAAVEITVKEIKEKVLPRSTTSCALRQRVDTLAELCADIEARLREQLEVEIENVFRANAVDMLCTVEGQPAGRSSVADASAADELRRSLERHCIPAETYLEISGRRPSSCAEAMRGEARLGSRASSRWRPPRLARARRLRRRGEDAVREQADAAARTPTP